MKIDMQQNTQEWIDFRKNKIGASDAPIIMKKSPWSTPKQLWERKLGLIPDQKENESMKQGKILESMAMVEFYYHTKLKMTPTVYQSDDYGWMIASFDGITEDAKEAVEIKCPGIDDHSLAIEGKIPEKYIPQLQHQMHVAKLDRIFYFSFFNGYGKILVLDRDQDYINKLIQEERDFWLKIQNLECPELTDKDFSNKSDPEWISAVNRWKIARNQLKTIQDEEESARQLLIHLSQGVSCKGSGVQVSKIHRKGNIDYKEIPELKNVDVDKYRKPTSVTWRISLEEKNDDC